MVKRARRLIAVVATSFALVGGIATPALAQTQDGLVNVMIGDVTILEDVNIAVAANILANVCANVNVQAALAVIGDVDSGQTADFVCRIGGGNPNRTGGQNIRIVQN
jgi:hypothetical protein